MEPDVSHPKIGFIGFGEAAAALSAGLLAAGMPKISAFDTRPRPAVRGVEMAKSLAGLIAGADVVIAAVTSAVAVDVAKAAAKHLTPRQFYVDINSVSPEVKIAIGRVIDKAGARFVEAAVMAAVPPFKHKVPMLLGGKAAPELMQILAPYGMVLEDFGHEIGRAAATKMFRSVVVKGLEALLQECVLGADRYGVADRVLDSVRDGYPGLDWKALADYLIGRTAIHGVRRAHEMTEVAETLNSLGIEPMMSAAAAKRIAWAGGFGLKDKFGDTPPKSFHEVLEALREARKKKAKKKPGKKKKA
jgi:3-hydroxyisobutyrate dehydrogenase